MANFPTTVSTDSNLYIAKNNLRTSLNGSLNISDTTVNVFSTSGFPTVGYFTVGTEAVKYTNLTSTSFTGCTRGADGTTAASHTPNSVVFHAVVAAHHNALKDEVIAIETYLAGETVIDVKKVFGAVGDGVADDSGAIQAALNLANARGGGLVYFPKGTYLIGTRLKVYSYTTLLGAGPSLVVLKAKVNLDDRLLANQAWDGSGTDADIHFENILFDMNGTNQSGSTAVTMARLYGHHVTHVEFRNPYDSLYLFTGGGDTTVNANAIYTDVFFWGANQVQAADVVDIGNATNVRMIHCRAKDAKTGSGSTVLSIACIDSFIASDSYFDGNNNGAVSRVTGVTGGKLDGCEIMNSAEAGIRMDRWAEGTPNWELDGFEIVNCRIHDNAYDGIWLRAESLITDVPLRIAVSHCQIFNNQRAAVKCEIVDGLSVTNCDIYNNSLAGAGNYPVFNFDGVFSSAVHVKNVRINNNRIFDTQGSPTQTKLFVLDWADTVVSEDNIISQITTVSAETNSTNIRLLGKRQQQVMAFTFPVAAGQTNKFISILDANYSRVTDFFIERVSVRLENATGAAQSVAAIVTDGTTTMTATASNDIAATTTTNAFLLDVSAKDLTIKYTSSGGCATGLGVVTITGYEKETVLE